LLVHPRLDLITYTSCTRNTPPRATHMSHHVQTVTRSVTYLALHPARVYTKL